jgi:hypothetical protein
MEPQQEETQTTLARSLVRAYPHIERDNLLKWSQAVIAIRNTSWPKHRKLVEIGKVTHEMGVTKPFVKHLASELKRVGWDERTKTMRGVIGGAGIGLLASLASPMAGVAAFGGAIAVPVVLLSAGAGAVLSAIVEELTRGK